MKEGQDGHRGAGRFGLPKPKALVPKLCLFVLCLLVIQAVEPAISSLLKLEKVIDRAAYGWLADHARAPKPEDLKVALVDISEVEEVDSDVQPGERVSNPAALGELVERLASAGAKVVAIDIDMGSQTGVPLHSGQVKNLDEWSKLTQSEAGPSIVVGVFEATSLGSDNWDRMKASLAIEDVKGRAVDEIQSPVWGGPLSGMARKIVEELARRGGGNPAPRLSGPRGFMAFLFESDESQEGSITIQSRYIQPQLVPYFAKNFLTPKEIEANHEVLKGKAVVLGDVVAGKFRDSFSFPAQEAPVPGAAIHAAASQAMLSPPVVKLNRWGSLLLSALIGVLMVVIKETCLLHFGENVLREEAFELVAGFCLFFITLLIAHTLLDKGAVLWQGYFLSPLSLPLGYILAKGVEYASHQAMKGGSPS